jgi:transcriptional regulator with GAF, ATPase, and Fis domain
LDEQTSSFEDALSQLSARFIAASLESIDGAVEEALRVVGETLRYQRTAVFLLEQGFFALTYEWCAPDVRSFKALMSGLSIAEFGWPLTAVAAGESVSLIRSELPPEGANARRVLERDDLEQMVIIPLRIAQKVVGCLALHARRARAISPAIAGRHQLIADVVAGALARKHAEEAQQRAYGELERLKNRAEDERDYLRREIASGAQIVAHSPQAKRILQVIDVVAATGATVLLCGESGVGKEVFARAIHMRSPRREGPLVKVNCASVPKELFESEFFGHVRGAFTGAHKDRAGRFELAHGGTLFLDEIGEIPIEQQAKLLRVLQESEFERVGDDRTRKVDVRIVAATNRKLETEVQAGRFRQDLYYRISVFPMDIPPLRERREDILPLAEYFLREQAPGRTVEIGESQRRLLMTYDWPGNVRELQHVIERAVILSPGATLELEQALQPRAAASLAPPPAAAARPSAVLMTDDEMRALERDNLRAALERAGWRIAGPGGAAELLGMRPSTLRDRMKAFGLSRGA